MYIFFYGKNVWSQIIFVFLRRHDKWLVGRIGFEKWTFCCFLRGLICHMSWKDTGQFNSWVLGLVMMYSSQCGEEEAIVISSGGQPVDLGNQIDRISSTLCKCIRPASMANLVLIGAFLTSDSWYTCGIIIPHWGDAPHAQKGELISRQSSYPHSPSAR